MIKSRAAWVKFREFSPDQRQRFHKILKMEPGKTDRFIDLIQSYVPDYIMGTTILNDSPPEPAGETRDRLLRISDYSKKLWDELTNLDQDGAGMKLDLAQMRLPHPCFDLHILEDSLMYLCAISGGAAQTESQRTPGRPPNYVNYRFIVTCFEKFEEVFGKSPKYSKGTKFQNFLRAVSEEVCPPEMILRGDITKTVQAAIGYGESKK